MQLSCATGNSGKLREFRLAANHAPVAIQFLEAYRSLPVCEEDGETFEANAIKKALHYGAHAPGMLFADDSGLEVGALGGAPGVYSARFSGPQATDESNNRLLLQKMRGVKERAARFVCVIALAEASRVIGIYRGTIEGVLLEDERGAGGFGYDPLFYSPAAGCTLAEATPEQKFALSHRGQALRQMLADLQSMGKL